MPRPTTLSECVPSETPLLRGEGHPHSPAAPLRPPWTCSHPGHALGCDWRQEKRRGDTCWGCRPGGGKRGSPSPVGEVRWEPHHCGLGLAAVTPGGGALARSPSRPIFPGEAPSGPGPAERARLLRTRPRSNQSPARNRPASPRFQPGSARGQPRVSAAAGEPEPEPGQGCAGAAAPLKLWAPERAPTPGARPARDGDLAPARPAPPRAPGHSTGGLGAAAPLAGPGCSPCTPKTPLRAPHDRSGRRSLWGCGCAKPIGRCARGARSPGHAPASEASPAAAAAAARGAPGARGSLLAQPSPARAARSGTPSSPSPPRRRRPEPRALEGGSVRGTCPVEMRAVAPPRWGPWPRCPPLLLGLAALFSRGEGGSPPPPSAPQDPGLTLLRAKACVAWGDPRAGTWVPVRGTCARPRVGPCVPEGAQGEGLRAARVLPREGVARCKRWAWGWAPLSALEVSPAPAPPQGRQDLQEFGPDLAAGRPAGNSRSLPGSGCARLLLGLSGVWHGANPERCARAPDLPL